MLKLFALTAMAIFAAEALVMLVIESLGEGLPLYARALIDSTLLLLCVFPALYFLIFKELAEQIRLRRSAEEMHKARSQNLEMLVAERTEGLRHANEDLLVEVQERARSGMTLRKGLSEERSRRERLQAAVDALQESLVVVDENGNILLANLAAKSLFSNGAYELHGQTLADLLCPESPGTQELGTPLDNLLGCRLVRLASGGRSDEEKPGLVVRIGARFDWQGVPATVVTFMQME